MVRKFRVKSGRAWRNWELHMIAISTLKEVIANEPTIIEVDATVEEITAVVKVPIEEIKA